LRRKRDDIDQPTQQLSEDEIQTLNSMTQDI
jgi:hypothetical protein